MPEHGPGGSCIQPVRLAVGNRDTPFVFTTCLIRQRQERGMADAEKPLPNFGQKPLRRKAILDAVGSFGGKLKPPLPAGRKTDRISPLQAETKYAWRVRRSSAARRKVTPNTAGDRVRP